MGRPRRSAPTTKTRCSDGIANLTAGALILVRGPKSNQLDLQCAVEGVSSELSGIPHPAMSTSDLRSLLDDVPDTLEIVLRREPSWSPVAEAWRDAAEEAEEEGEK